MKDEETIRLREQIRKTEQEVFRKRSELAAAEIMTDEPGVINPQMPAEWEEAFSGLISLIGETSEGGNSIDDVAHERKR